MKLGLGIILRDESGDLLPYKMLKLLGLHAVKESEALALLEAISWVRTLSCNKVLFEIDSQMVVNALAYGSRDNTKFGVLTISCHLLLCFEHDFKVVLYRGMQMGLHMLWLGMLCTKSYSTL